MELGNVDLSRRYTRAAVARAAGIEYHVLYYAEQNGVIPTPSYIVGRTRYYTPIELGRTLAWLEIKAEVARK